MYRFHTNGSGTIAQLDRARWAAEYVIWHDLGRANGLKPPHSWIDAQLTDKGRNDVAAISIWHRRYDLARKLGIWLNATDDDFRRAGYLDGGIS